MKKVLPALSILVHKLYSNDRSFYVNFNGIYSDIHVINSDAPQSGIMGPAFYTIYITDTPEKSLVSRLC